MPSRRSVLGSLALSAAVGGCFGSSYGSGDLVLDNALEEEVSVVVGVERYEDDAARGDDGPAPGAEPTSERTELYRLDGGATHHEPGFFDAAGLYYVRAAVGGGEVGRTWADFSSADDGVAGPHVRATVAENRDVTLSTGYD